MWLQVKKYPDSLFVLLLLKMCDSYYHPDNVLAQIRKHHCFKPKKILIGGEGSVISRAGWWWCA
jgi:hypothetical protein